MSRGWGMPRRGAAALAFAALALMSAVVAVLPALDRSLPVADVTGSPPSQPQTGRVAANVLGGGDFVTRAADGAHAAVHLARPLAFGRIEHRYAAEVWPQHRVRGAAMQWSDDGRTWRDADAARSEDGRLAFDVRQAGAHAHWRLLVLESGGNAEVVIGSLTFRRSAWAEIPVDLAWLGWGLALLAAVAALPGGLTRPRAFAVAAVTASLFVLAYTLLFAPHWVMLCVDSGAYAQPLTQGGYAAYRSAGYPTFLRLVHAAVGLERLVWVQLALELLCFMAALALLARAYGLWLAGAAVALLAASLGMFATFAAQLMTEALFVSGFTLAAGALAAAARRPGTALYVAAGLGLAVATAAKAVGIVLVVPALLLARFLPRSDRRRAATFLLLLPLGVYAAMVAHGYRRAGGLTPEAAGGFALAGQVAGFLGGDVPEAPGLVPALREAVGPVLAARPAGLDRIDSKQALDRYIAVTVGDYNRLLWEAMVPATTRYLGARASQVTLNRVLTRVAAAAIVAHPLDYARHVAAHYYGLWRDLGLSQAADLPGAALSMRAELAGLDDAQRANLTRYVEPALPPLPDGAVIRDAAGRQQAVPLAFRGLFKHSLLGRPEVTLGIGALALLLAGLVLLPGPLARAYAGEIMLALMLDAYALAQALFQVTLARYADVLMPVSVLLVACFAATTLGLLRRAALSVRTLPALSAEPAVPSAVAETG